MITKTLLTGKISLSPNSKKTKKKNKKKKQKKTPKKQKTFA